mmetsp:Transcript_59213/g.63893  ORF Transcript_59213/g.63893 Transcript_59213/m.63893 type:complete len:362 (-) Transcript_59213:1405-2490(-)
MSHTMRHTCFLVVVAYLLLVMIDTTKLIGWVKVKERLFTIQTKPDGSSDEKRVAIIDGEWIEVSNRTFASPVCCEGDGAISPMVDSGPTLGSQGKQCTEDGFRPQLVNGCKCDDFLDKYEWSSAALSAQFDPNTTCQILGNRTVALIGDSTMAQVASTLINSLVPGGCHNQISIHSADTLVKRDFGGMNRGKHFIEYLYDLKPDIAIVGVGPHISHNHNSSFYSIVNEVLSDMNEIKLRWGNNITFGWKTQQPGGCSQNMTNPKNPLATKSGLLNTTFRHNWELFYEWDEMLTTQLEEIKMPFLDLRMLYSRTDGHISSRGKLVKYWGRKEEYTDCLHLCTPGPLDVVSRLFHNFLLQSDS